MIGSTTAKEIWTVVMTMIVEVLLRANSMMDHLRLGPITMETIIVGHLRIIEALLVVATLLGDLLNEALLSVALPLSIEVLWTEAPHPICLVTITTVALVEVVLLQDLEI